MNPSDTAPANEHNIHATCVAIDGVGILLRGPSGSGKSDLALRLIDSGAELVADDRVLLSGGHRVIARAPESIAGRIEVRGLGIVTLAYRPSVALGLIADLVPADQIERLPEAATCRYFESDFPLIRVAPEMPSAPAKVRLAVRGLRRDSMAAR